MMVSNIIAICIDSMIIFKDFILIFIYLTRKNFVNSIMKIKIYMIKI